MAEFDLSRAGNIFDANMAQRIKTQGAMDQLTRKSNLENLLARQASADKMAQINRAGEQQINNTLAGLKFLTPELEKSLPPEFVKALTLGRNIDEAAKAGEGLNQAGKAGQFSTDPTGTLIQRILGNMTPA